MKRFSIFAIVLFAFTVALSVAAQDTYTVKTRTARVRAEPNTTSSVVATLSLYTELNVIEAVEGANVSGSRMWYHIQLTNRTGYIHSSLVQAPASGGFVPSGNSAASSGNSSSSAISTPAPDAPPIAPPQTGVTCNGKTVCRQMDSCEQAYACLAAGRSSLDRDKDGVPCESICPGG